MPVEILSSSGHLEQPEGDGAPDRATVADSGLSPDWRSDATGIPDGDEQVAALRACPHGCPTNANHTHLAGGEPIEFGPAALFTRCGWCKAVMVEGPLSPEGLESTGICKECTAREDDRVLAAATAVSPLHVIPSQDRIGGYIIRDDNDRLIVDNLSGVNSAAAIAHILNNAIHGYGLCVLHLNERRANGSCFPCTLGAPRHPFAAVGRS